MGVELVREAVEKLASPVNWAVRGGSGVADGGFDAEWTSDAGCLERQDRHVAGGKAHLWQARDRSVELGKEQITAAELIKVGIRKYRASAGAAGSPPAVAGQCDSEDIGLWAGQ